jgi:hypothetical protein
MDHPVELRQAVPAGAASVGWADGREVSGTHPYGGFLAAGQLGKPLFFVAATAAGVLVTATLAVTLKSLRRTVPARKAGGVSARGARVKAPVVDWVPTARVRLGANTGHSVGS